jgi:hypothetical protein
MVLLGLAAVVLQPNWTTKAKREARCCTDDVRQQCEDHDDCYEAGFCVMNNSLPGVVCGTWRDRKGSRIYAAKLGNISFPEFDVSTPFSYGVTSSKGMMCAADDAQNGRVHALDHTCLFGNGTKVGLFFFVCVNGFEFVEVVYHSRIRLFSRLATRTRSISKHCIRSWDQD